MLPWIPCLGAFVSSDDKDNTGKPDTGYNPTKKTKENTEKSDEYVLIFPIYFGKIIFFCFTALMMTNIKPESQISVTNQPEKIKTLKIMTSK